MPTKLTKNVVPKANIKLARQPKDPNPLKVSTQILFTNSLAELVAGNKHEILKMKNLVVFIKHNNLRHKAFLLRQTFG